MMLKTKEKDRFLVQLLFFHTSFQCNIICNERHVILNFKAGMSCHLKLHVSFPCRGDKTKTHVSKKSRLVIMNKTRALEG